MVAPARATPLSQPGWRMVSGEKPRRKAKSRRAAIRSSLFAIRRSHIWIIRPAAAFGRHPGDVLVGVFDIAGFTVDAVLRVDHKAWLAGFLDPFINGSRAVTRRRSGIDVVLG